MDDVREKGEEVLRLLCMPYRHVAGWSGMCWLSNQMHRSTAYSTYLRLCISDRRL